MHSGPDELFHKLLLEILDDHALGTDLLGLGFDGIVVLILSLTIISAYEKQ